MKLLTSIIIGRKILHYLQKWDAMFTVYLSTGLESSLMVMMKHQMKKVYSSMKMYLKNVISMVLNH